ncbi:MAG: FkbM family methyltransferase [Chloroflexi bacterium SZAS-1]|nr:FkbM family methyltransferase [Chloroflexi bacterium SZAS-1]
MKLRHLAGKAIHRVRKQIRSTRQISYAQCGEDIIVRFIFNALRIKQPSYLDLGAHTPVHLSNTFLFYRTGSRGVCVEPDPTLFAAFKRKRPHDICLNIGVGTKEDVANFYIMTSRSLNTFAQAEAERYQSYGKQRIEAIVPIQLNPINQIILQNFSTPPYFLSIDIEGLELPILQELDFAALRPMVLCVETIEYTEDRTEQKRRDLIEFVQSKGYMIYADTYINTIFVDRQIWLNRP